MNDLVDMKQKRSKSDNMPESSGSNDYPYGLSFSLDKDSLKKLGLDKDLPEIGEEYHLMATVKVTRVSESASTTDMSSDVSLQITKMSLDDMDSAKHEKSEGEAYSNKSTMRMK
jgi:hypothetical protein